MSQANESEPIVTKRAAFPEPPRFRPFDSNCACRGSKRNSWLSPATNHGLPSLPGSRLGRPAGSASSSLTVPSLSSQ